MNIKTTTITFTGVGIALNIVLAVLAKSFKIPFLFLDTVGTILVGAVLGPIFGGLTGLITNIITAMVNNPVELPFAIVNMAIGVVVGLISRKFGFTLKVAVPTGILLAILAPMIGTPIAVYLFGGLAGGSLDILTGWLVKSGQKIFTATFIPRIISNLIDKIGSCVVVSIIISRIPGSLLRKIKGE
ncbi:ECF transporter S component [Cetobacterium sp. 2A]|uniref:CD3073 family putative ECF transporter S component n=1 Tax=unclassified Cetobacterium TaxID=2630983 RepID=UPI00163BEF3A|nr:CD3073 family putative ECF transporter S component [Cetobacterium sp. 2A]MBC2854938.1 ECF transporter S component [Cetobacterium sp. 2A]